VAADGALDTVAQDAAKDSQGPDAADAGPDAQGTDAVSVDAAADAGPDAQGTDAASVDAAADVKAGDVADAQGGDATDVKGGDATADVTGVDATDAQGGDVPDAQGVDATDVQGGDLADAQGTDAATTEGVSDVAADAAAAPSCAEYCAVIHQNCTGANAQYTDVNDCLNYCNNVGKLALGTTADLAGDTVGCRTYHANAAASDAVLHCPHAGKTGANTCGSWCEVYCDLAMSNCTDTNALYDDKIQCMAGCGQLAATGLYSDKSGDTVQCRIAHLGFAGVDGPSALTHCPHALIHAAVGSPCGPATQPAAKTWAVKTTANFSFDPMFLWIRAGDSVTFTVGAIHTATQVLETTWDADGNTQLDGGFNIPGGSTQTLLFAAAAEAYYVCLPHASMGMKGKIVVQ